MALLLRKHAQTARKHCNTANLSMTITFTLFLSHLTCWLLMMETSDILGQISDDSPDEIQDRHTEDLDPTQLVRAVRNSSL